MQSLKTLINAVKVWADSRFAKKTDIIEPVNADWDCNDPNDPSYIKNKIAGVTRLRSSTVNSYGYSKSDDSTVHSWGFLVVPHELCNTDTIDMLVSIVVHVSDGNSFNVRFQENYWWQWQETIFGKVRIGDAVGNLEVWYCVDMELCPDYEVNENLTAYFEIKYYKQIDDKYLPKYMSAENPTGTGSFSMNRLPNSTVGQYSVAEGYFTTASGHGSHADGDYTTASGYGSHAEGYNTTASGDYSHAEGYNTRASGQATHSEGWCSKATNSSAHAEGSNTTASGTYSHAEGGRTTASGWSAHAEGSNTTASGTYSHAEGIYTTASSDCSHAEGYYTNAGGDYSHSDGYYTTAKCKSQSAHGEYNVLDTTGRTSTRGSYVTIVGNGTSTSARSNAHTLDWSGNAWFAGDVYVGSTGGKNKDAGSVKLAKSTEVTAVDSKVTAVSNKVVVGGASDITSGTELFVDSSSDGFVEVPTMDELNEVKSKLEDEYVLSELVGAGIITPVSSTGGALFTSSSGKVYVV